VAVLRVTDDHRRARIARRHGLSPEHRFDSIEAATVAMTALHATEPATPHLSLHARMHDLTVPDVEAALYERRTLVRTMAMRRTLWIVTRDLVPAVTGSAGRRVADVHDEFPDLGGTFTAAPGTKWSTDVATMSRLLVILAATGDVVRGHNAGHWRISRPTWTSMTSWLGEEVTPAESEAGYGELVRHLLSTFGPATEADLVWWLGATKRAVRQALSDSSAIPVELDDGTIGWLLPDDTADVDVPASTEPWVALLPTLDPTTMGWRGRKFYLDPAHTPYLFDRAGNAGTTVWVDGRIVGCWVQDENERVELVLLDDVSGDARRRLDVEAARLDDFLRGEHVTNVFASPQMKHQRLS
jgi:hypothetical protein